MPYTLVIIDMQDNFLASRKESVQKDIAKQIKKAMKDRAGIIFVEYLGCGKTYSQLVDLSEDYDRSFTVYKDRDDGSKEVLNCLVDKKLPKSRLRVCGVNTQFCVRSTAVGLRDKLPKSKLQIIAKSCNSDYGHECGLNSLKEFDNLSIS